MIVVVILVTALLFVLISFVPGDPITARYGIEGQSLSPEQEHALRARYGLDRPLPVQYARWVRSVMVGDFGESILQRRPVWDVIVERIPVTMQVQGIALLLALGIAVPFGIVAAFLVADLPA